MLETVTPALLIQTRMALGLSQQQLGDLLGKTKRTIQRWEDRGTQLLQEEAVILANAVRPVRPDLAEAILALQKASPSSVSADELASLVAMAASSLAMTEDAVRAAAQTVFVLAQSRGLDPAQVAAALVGGGGIPPKP